MTRADVGARRRRIGAVRPLALPVLGATGLLGAAGVVLGASQPGAPFAVQGPGAWFFGTVATSATVAVDRRFLGIMLVYGGVALLLGSWYEVVRRVRAVPATPVRSLVPVLLAWALPIAVGPPLFSQDVYSYAAQGEMVSKGISPYVHGPSSLGPGRFLSLVNPLWRHAPAPYGPAWERLSGWMAQASGHDVLGSVIGFRVVAAVGVTLVAVAVPVLARSVGSDASVAFALGVLNPLVLLALLGGAHNDALMLGLLAAGCAVARRRHVLAGLVLCALAAEVKIPALIGAVFIGWWWAGSGAPWGRRLARVVLAVAGTVGLMAALAAVSGLGWRWTSGLSNPGTVVSWLDPVTGVGLLVARLAGALGLGAHQNPLVHGVRAVGLLVAAAISVRLLVRSGDRDPLTAVGGCLLAVVLLGPVVWPWYETWGLVFLAVAAVRWAVPVIFVLSVLACVADVPRPGLLGSGRPVLVALVWAALAAAVALYVVTRVVGPGPGADGVEAGPGDGTGDVPYVGGEARASTA